MALWQIGLLALAIVWGLQAFGTFVQMRHYRVVMGDISARWSDGHLGAGNARGTLGKGVILVLVTDPAGLIRTVRLMEGRSVFARFVEVPALAGRALDAVRREGAFPAAEKARNAAFEQAAQQIDRAVARSAEPVVAALPAAAGA